MPPGTLAVTDFELEQVRAPNSEQLSCEVAGEGMNGNTLVCKRGGGGQGEPWVKTP